MHARDTENDRDTKGVVYMEMKIQTNAETVKSVAINGAHPPLQLRLFSLQGLHAIQLAYMTHVCRMAGSN